MEYPVSSERTTHRLPRWKRALFAGILLALTAAFTEVVARAVDAWTYVSVEELRETYRQRRDWRLGRSWPLQRGDYPYLPYVPNPEHPDVNELGFHGESFSAEKGPDTYRVFCLGGSTTWTGYPVFLENELLFILFGDGDFIEPAIACYSGVIGRQNVFRNTSRRPCIQESLTRLNCSITEPS